ncbi:hypothetical protein CDL15_Pgr006264 [Punica granatum]|uniref:7-deoxyloganetin glucosyltransferase-like n=1 Tax=Punica granatum TaxID=22663 RepID=A0A218X5L0_PUNGR|nr:hypothetical protein CDL15_Pgr006264 [Punica granatum]
MRNIRLRDMPSFIRTTDPNDLMVHFAITQVEKVSMASALILNTFDALEHDVLEALSSTVPWLYTVGPLQLLLKNVSMNGSLESIGSNLWKEQPGCLEWLDSREPQSVVYVNFGSVTLMTTQQLIGFAWGLTNSRKPFLWVIRPDLVTGESAVLPPEFLPETEGRSLIASWCPQEQVLSHPAVGGFLTHCGWNSTIESLCGGMPMIC